MSYTVDVGISPNSYLRSKISNTGMELSILQSLVFKDKKLTTIKNDGSLITAGDPLSQIQIIETLKIIDRVEGKKRPVIAEENGLDVLRSVSNYWLLDPLDGTYVYVKGLYGWGIILSEVLDGEVVRAFVYCHGAKPQIFEYCKHGGFSVNGSPLPKTRNTGPESLLVSKESLDDLKESHPCLHSRIIELYRKKELLIRDSKSAASSLFSICNSGCSYISTKTKIWEVNALRALIHYGGTVLNLDDELHDISTQIRQPVFASLSNTLYQRLFG